MQRRFYKIACAAVSGAVIAAAPLGVGAQVSAASSPPAMDDGARTISLKEAVEMAQRNSVATIQARGQERLAGATLRTAKAAYFPTLNIQASTQRLAGQNFDSNRGDLVTLNPTWSYGNQANFSLELFDGFRRSREISRVRATGDAADAAIISSRFDAALQAKQQYYAALAAREAEAAARAQLEQAQQQLRASTARVSAGVVTKSDSLRSVIQVGTASLAVLTAQSNLRVANAALTRVIGSESLVTPTANDTLELPATTLDVSGLDKLVNEAPAVQLAEANLLAARASQRAQRSQYLPTLTSTYVYSFSQSNRGSIAPGNLYLITGGNPNQNRLGFTLSYPVFNGFTREQSTVQNSIAVTNSEAALRDARLAARSTFTSVTSALTNANARIEVQLQTIAAAEEDLRVQQQRYALGASTLLDLLTSQTQLNQARNALIQARFDARVARAQLESLVGRVL